MNVLTPQSVLDTPHPPSCSLGDALARGGSIRASSNHGSQSKHAPTNPNVSVGLNFFIYIYITTLYPTLKQLRKLVSGCVCQQAHTYQS